MKGKVETKDQGSRPYSALYFLKYKILNIKYYQPQNHKITNNSQMLRVDSVTSCAQVFIMIALSPNLLSMNEM